MVLLRAYAQLVLLALLSPARGALKYVGVDWSSVLVEERSGIQYRNVAGLVQPLEKILKDNGVDTVRQRIWVNPANGDYGLDYNLQLAKRAKAAGLDVYLDFHYADSWADPGKQPTPRGWPAEINALTTKLYDYTRSVCDAFEKAGVQPNIISIGNEIRSGLLWPTGKTNNFANIAKLLAAASKAVKESSLSPQPKIMIHLDNGWDWGAQQWWYQSVLSAGGLALDAFDQMGVSYYPFYGSGATLAALKSSLANMARTWGKEIVVAETNWPQSCPRPSQQFPSDLRGFAFSADGQTQFIKAVAGIVEGTAKGVGLFYWEPAWVDNAGLGSSCDANTMFAWPGTALSSISVYSQI
jgi:arabinogalactan endo-1,4-beta-galactosidase